MEDITKVDYRIQGYKKRKFENEFGDVHKIEFYSGYDGNAATEDEKWIDLKVRETRSFDRSQGTGVPNTNNVTIEWFGSDKESPRANKILVKPLNINDGLKENVNSRTRLINQAKVTALGIMGLQNGQNFLASVSLEINTYKEGNIVPLISAINGSTDPNATQIFKDAMTSILDITYVPD